MEDVAIISSSSFSGTDDEESVVEHFWLFLPFLFLLVLGAIDIEFKRINLKKKKKILQKKFSVSRSKFEIRLPGLENFVTVYLATVILANNKTGTLDVQSNQA